MGFKKISVCLKNEIIVLKYLCVCYDENIKVNGYEVTIELVNVFAQTIKGM